MASRLIINADDFGLTPGINRAIAELHQANALTSATLRASGPAFEDAVQIAHAHPNLGVGCHIVLTDGVPVSNPQSIPTLLGVDGKTFRSSLFDFVQALLRGSIREEDIELEATAQVQKLQRAGIAVTHLDTHKHTHLFPAVTRPLQNVAEHCSVLALRNPFEPGWSVGLGHGSGLRRLQMRLLGSLHAQFVRQPRILNSQLQTTDATIGISATGCLNRSTLQQILQALPSDGAFELCCHPGYNDRSLDLVKTRLRAHRDTERYALLAEIPKLALHPNAPQLIHYGSLRSSGGVRDAAQFVPRTGHEQFF